MRHAPACLGERSASTGRWQTWARALASPLIRGRRCWCSGCGSRLVRRRRLGGFAAFAEKEAHEEELGAHQLDSRTRAPPRHKRSPAQSSAQSPRPTVVLVAGANIETATAPSGQTEQCAMRVSSRCRQCVAPRGCSGNGRQCMLYSLSEKPLSGARVEDPQTRQGGPWCLASHARSGPTRRSEYRRAATATAPPGATLGGP